MNRILRPLVIGLLTLLVACEAERPLTNGNDSTPVGIPTDVDLTVKGTYAPLDGRAPMQRDEINRIVIANLMEHDEFRWDMADDYANWSALVATDSILSVGYQPNGYANVDETIHEIDVTSPEWKSVRDALVNFIVTETNTRYPDKEVTAEDLLAFGESGLPYFNIQVFDYDILAQLKRMEVVRYAEPMGYGSEESARSGSGCGSNNPDNNIPASDYTTISPNAKVSWNFASMNIQQAWNYSTGNNITVGLIDTGLDPDQSKLNGSFASGQSTNRFRQKYSSYVTGWWWWASLTSPNDECGHGTSMAGMICAPRSSGGSSVGVAYEANLVSYKGTSDVIINGSNEKDGVSDALVALGNRNDVRIISMSIGDVFTSGQVRDAVNYAYNRGKLIFAAAGTSLTWTNWWGVIFPANLSNTVAVTGIKTGTPMVRCNICHDGSAVDFVVEMQDRNNDDRLPLTLADAGNTPSRVGGSSVATATTAGLAALVWARNPGQSRNDVLQRMKEASQYYPSRSGSFGWGKIDALAAVQAVQ